jgi:hypothetical protein
VIVEAIMKTIATDGRATIDVNISGRMRSSLYRSAACLALFLSGVAGADTSPRRPGGVERRWSKGDWQFVTNDPFVVQEEAGDVLALQIKGYGESCAIRKRAWPLQFPCRVIFRMRWTENAYGNAYPSAHLLFDPPAHTDEWWKCPFVGGAWAGNKPVYLFHFATDAGWRRVGMSQNLESAAAGHEYGPPKGQWLAVLFVLERDKVVVSVDGKEVARTEVDLSGYRTFSPGFGDQTSTRVELDELRVLPGR